MGLPHDGGREGQLTMVGARRGEGSGLCAWGFRDRSRMTSDRGDGEQTMPEICGTAEAKG